MFTAKERKLIESGIDETSKKGRREFIWGLCPQAPGIYRFDANPSLFGI
jgi:hypothetical protein